MSRETHHESVARAMSAAVAAAQKAGVKWYFIEDESPTSEDQIPQSLKYLEHVTW